MGGDGRGKWKRVRVRACGYGARRGLHRQTALAAHSLGPKIQID